MANIETARTPESAKSAHHRITWKIPPMLYPELVRAGAEHLPENQTSALKALIGDLIYAEEYQKEELLAEAPNPFLVQSTISISEALEAKVPAEVIMKVLGRDFLKKKLSDTEE